MFRCVQLCSDKDRDEWKKKQLRCWRVISKSIAEVIRMEIELSDMAGTENAHFSSGIGLWGMRGSGKNETLMFQRQILP